MTLPVHNDLSYLPDGLCDAPQPQAPYPLWLTLAIFLGVFAVLQWAWSEARGTAVERLVIHEATVKPAVSLTRAAQQVEQGWVLALRIGDLLSYSLNPEADAASLRLDWTRVREEGGRFAFSLAMAFVAAGLHQALISRRRYGQDEPHPASHRLISP